MSEGEHFEDCMQSSPDAAAATANELELYRARKVAMITGISGQVIDIFAEKQKKQSLDG